LNDLGTDSISDLFHVLYDLNRSIGFELNCLASRLHKQIKRASLNQAKLEVIEQLEASEQILQQSRLTYDHCCHRLSICLHPFDINQNTRNGYLSQAHHNRRGLSSKRLQVSTAIHNFSLKRNDGTTAAERLFGQQFPDLFEYLVENIGELPQARKSRKLSKTETKALPTVPL